MREQIGGKEFYDKQCKIYQRNYNAISKFARSTSLICLFKLRR